MSSRLSPSFSFFPRRRFFPPFPLFLGILNFSLLFSVYSQKNHSKYNLLFFQLSSGLVIGLEALASQAT